MQRAHSAQLACVRCFSLMNQVEEIAVLGSLNGLAVFTCDTCGHVTLVREHEPLRSAS